MQLPGRLSASTLGDLLGQLHRNRITGLLELWEIGGAGPVPGGRHRVHLSCGLVTDVETRAPVPPLGEILRHQGRLGIDGIHRMLRRVAAGDGRRAGEILLEEGLIDRDLLDSALRAQLWARLDALFHIKDATVRFHTARPAPAGRASALAPGDFLPGRPRARDGGRAPSSAPRHAAPARQAPPARQNPRRTDSYSEASIAARHDETRARALRTLGLPPGVDGAEVRRAFRRLASELHPDRQATAPLDVQQRSAARFAELTEAYHWLVG